MKDIKTFIESSINEAFNEKEHLELKKDFIKEVGDCWDQFVKFILKKCTKRKWDKYSEEYGAASLIDFLSDVCEIDAYDIAEKIKCDGDKLSTYMDEKNDELSFTIDEFIGYNKRI